jgi:hypothetical protein
MKAFLLLCIVLALPIPAYCQHWERLSDPPSNKTTSPFGETRVPYFIDSTHGFVYNAGWPITSFSFSNVQRTADGGRTWHPIDFFDNSGLIISQICFVSQMRGYASTFGGIFETFDFGDHWHRISAPSPFIGVYAIGSTIYGSELKQILQHRISHYIIGQIWFSRDDGNTWDTISKIVGLPDPQGKISGFQRIYGNRDSLIATVWLKSTGLGNPHPFSATDPHGNPLYGGLDSLYDTYLVYSTDFGKTWQSKLLDSKYYWGDVALYILPHSCKIFRQYLDTIDELGDTYSLLSGEPDYASWQTVIEHREIGAWVSGNSCALYLNNAADGVPPSADLNTTGMLFRSTDGGVLWQSFQKQYGTAPAFNEIDDRDFQNIAVVGHGAIVYADSFGFRNGTDFPVFTSLWKTSDGGDGSLNAAELAPHFVLGHAPFPSGTDTLIVNMCRLSSAIIFNQNIGCSYAKFDSVAIAGITTSEYKVVSTHHCGCQPMPDTSFIMFMPNDTGTYNLVIHYHFTDDEFEQIDTITKVTLIVNPGAGAIPLTLNIKSATIMTHPGDTIDIPVYLCGNGILGLTSLILPFGMDTNVLQPIAFHPAMSGITVDTITFSNGTAILPLHISGLKVSGETLIGMLHCIVYLADTLVTSVSLINASITSENFPCIALSLTTDSFNIEITGCGTATLMQFMKTGTIHFGIQGVTPNPFSNSTTIKFLLSDHSLVEVSIFNLFGSEVARLFSGMLYSGEHSFAWDAHGMPTGMYIAVVKSGDQMRQVPLTLVK